MRAPIRKKGRNLTSGETFKGPKEDVPKPYAERDFRLTASWKEKSRPKGEGPKIGVSLKKKEDVNLNLY